MRILLLLCAAFALSIAIEPVEEVQVAQETHQDEELPVEMLARRQEEELLPVEKIGGQMLGDVKTSSCPSGWSKYGSRCFILIHREMSWVDAERYCIRYGANLASVSNPGEYDFIQEVVRGATGRFPQTWLGGNDAIKRSLVAFKTVIVSFPAGSPLCFCKLEVCQLASTDYVWLWSDGTGFHFQHWSWGEPDNNEGNEKCLAMNHGDDLLMGDSSCELRLPFICGTRPL